MSKQARLNTDRTYCCCRTVELVAKQQHQPGEEVTLDYGCHPLQHMLYQYGFMPGHGTEGAVYEVFEDFGSMWEVLIVQASQQVSMSHCAASAARSFQGSPALNAYARSHMHSQSVLCLCKCTLCLLATSASRGVIDASKVCARSVLGSNVISWVAAKQSIMSLQQLHTSMNWQNLQGGVLSLKEVKLQPSSLSSPNASLACATSMHSKDQSIIYIIDNCINSTDACSTKVTWPDCVPESPQAGVQGDAQSGPDMHPTQHQCRKLEPAQER